MFLWNKVVVPLSICLLILFILALILVMFNIVESLVYTKLEEWKIRIKRKKTENAIKNIIFDGIMNNTDNTNKDNE